MPIRRALLSVSDKSGVVELAQQLVTHGVELLSTGGTARLLADSGVKVTEISDYTGFPEMMDGRVKTLHPRVHGGILGRRGVDDAVMSEHEIEPIDLVVINLYPFQQTVAKPDCSFDDAVENAVRINPANPQLHSDLATVLSYAGNHSRALESINRAIGRHTTPPTAYYGERARIYFFLGQYDKALEDAEHEGNLDDIRNFSLFIHGAMDNGDAAKKIAAARLQARPWESREYYSNVFEHYRRPEDIELILEAATRAGIP